VQRGGVVRGVARQAQKIGQYSCCLLSLLRCAHFCKQKGRWTMRAFFAMFVDLNRSLVFDCFSLTLSPLQDNTDEELVAAVDQLVGEVAVMEAEAGGSYFGSAASASAEKAQPQVSSSPFCCLASGSTSTGELAPRS